MKDCMECHRPCHPDEYTCTICEDVMCSEDCLHEHVIQYHQEEEQLSPIQVHDKIRDEVHKTKYSRHGETLTDTVERVALLGTHLPNLKKPDNEVVRKITGEE